MNAIDTNVLVYFVDFDGRHAATLANPSSRVHICDFPLSLPGSIVP